MTPDTMALSQYSTFLKQGTREGTWRGGAHTPDLTIMVGHIQSYIQRERRAVRQKTQSIMLFHDHVERDLTGTRPAHLLLEQLPYI